MVAYSVAAGDRLPKVVAAVGVAGCALCALALAGRWPSLFPAGLAGIGGAYGVFLSLRSGSVDSRAPLVAGALFLAAELGYWALEPGVGKARGSLIFRRIMLAGAGALAASFVGGLLLALAGGLNGGIALEAVGVGAAVLVLLTIAMLTARSRASAL